MTIKRNNDRPPKKRKDRGRVATSGLRPDLLDYVQAAAYIGVRTNTLRSWVANGMFAMPFLKVGRRVRFVRSRLDSWLLTRERGGGQFNPAPHAEQVEAR